MDENSAVAAFAALGQETRLGVLRRLVRAGAPGMLAGEIARELGVRQNTLSANLAVLVRAGLIHGERQGRGIRYRLDVTGLRGLLSFLIEDCCEGRPELCAPAGFCAPSASRDGRCS